MPTLHGRFIRFYQATWPAAHAGRHVVFQQIFSSPEWPPEDARKHQPTDLPTSVPQVHSRCPAQQMHSMIGPPSCAEYWLGRCRSRSSSARIIRRKSPLSPPDLVQRPDATDRLRRAICRQRQIRPFATFSGYILCQFCDLPIRTAGVRSPSHLQILSIITYLANAGGSSPWGQLDILVESVH